MLKINFSHSWKPLEFLFTCLSDFLVWFPWCVLSTDHKMSRSSWYPGDLSEISQPGQKQPSWEAGWIQFSIPNTQSGLNLNFLRIEISLFIKSVKNRNKIYSFRLNTHTERLATGSCWLFAYKFWGSRRRPQVESAVYDYVIESLSNGFIWCQLRLAKSGKGQ